MNENETLPVSELQILQQIAENPYNYDAWFDYIRLLQNEKVDREEMEDTFERAIANVPPQSEKRYFRFLKFIFHSLHKFCNQFVR